MCATILATIASFLRFKKATANECHRGEQDRGQPPPEVDPETTPLWTEVRDRLASRETPLNLDSLQFVYDSPQIVVTPELLEYAFPSFEPDRTWLAAILDLMSRIHRDFKYDSTATTISTPLQEVLKLRRGVCQDFAI